MNGFSCASLLLMILAVSPCVKAQAIANDISNSGNRFVEICSVTEKEPAHFDETDFLRSGLCQGFVLGLRDGAAYSLFALKETNSSLAYLKGSQEDLGVCVPDEVETGQMIRVILKYIRENPGRAHLATAQLVVLAQQQAFPCAKIVPGKPDQKR